MMENTYKKNVDLDAIMVLEAMAGGIDRLMAFGMARPDLFSGPDDVVGRAEWMKKQGRNYINQVVERAAEIERERESKSTSTGG